MTFTFAHPAAILPLGVKKYKYLDFTALVLGSMAPDFEYFIHFKPYQEYGHTILGQLFYNLPLVITTYFIYLFIIKQPLILNLPKPFCNYYTYLTKGDFRIKTLKQFGVIIYSSFIGMFTHLLWDSFTHKEGYFVKHMDILSKRINIIDHNIPIYKMLQHGSSLIGITILIIYISSIAQKEDSCKFNSRITSKLLYWTSIFLIDLLIAGSVIFILDDFSIGRIVVSFISGGFIGITVVSAAYRILKVI